MTLEINSITSGYSTGLINANFQKIENYINDSLLNRDGLDKAEVNQMELPLDMNSYPILNVGIVDDPKSLVNKEYVDNEDQTLAAGLAAVTRLQDSDLTVLGDAFVTTTTGSQALTDALDSRVIYVDTIADLQALPVGELVDGQQVQVQEYNLGTGVGGGEFYWDVASTEADNGGTIIKADAITTGRWKRMYKGSVTPEQFGARGDGTTLDRDPMERLGNYASAQQNIVIDMSPDATYLIGEQEFTGVADGRSYSFKPNLVINNIESVVINGNGAKMKFQSGLKFGSFDPVSGAVYNPPSMPFTDPDFRADIGFGILIEGCSFVDISNLEIDGNIANQTVGGTWGDTGRQCGAYGISLRDNDLTLVENIHTHHHCLDGIALRFAALPSENNTPTTFINVKSEYNARQGFSWTGGHGLTMTSCKFNYTADPSLPFFTAPSAGLDIEAEGGSSCRNLYAANCEFHANRAIGMVADSGDTADCYFVRCSFKTNSSTGVALWPNKPRFKFDSCNIHGEIIVTYISPNEIDGVTFTDCTFSDESKYGGPFVYGSNGLLSIDGRKNTKFRNCGFIAEKEKLGLFRGSAIFDDCYFEIRTEINPRTSVLNVESCTLRNCTIKEDLSGTLPAEPHSITDGLSKILDNTTINAVNNKLNWNSPTSGGGGFTGDNVSEPSKCASLKMNKRMREDSWAGFQTQYSNNVMPTSGEFNAGDFVWEDTPVIQGTAGDQFITLGWSRITTGSNHVSGTDWVECRVRTGT